MKKWLLSSIAILSSVAIISPLIASCSKPAVEPNQNNPDDNKEPTVNKIEAYKRQEPREASIIDVVNDFSDDERINFPTIKKVLVSTIDYKSFLDGTDELKEGLEDENSPYHYCNIGKEGNEKYWDVYYDSGWNNIEKTENIWWYSSDGYNKFGFPDFYITENDQVYSDTGIHKYWLKDGKIKEGACDEWAKATFSNGEPLIYSYKNYENMPFAFYSYNEDQNDPTTNLGRAKQNYQHIIDLANTLFEQDLNNIDPNKTITSIQSVQYDFTVKRDITVKVNDTDKETVTLNNDNSDESMNFYGNSSNWPILEYKHYPDEAQNSIQFDPNYIINQHWAFNDLMEFINSYNSKAKDLNKDKIVGIDSTIGGFNYEVTNNASNIDNLDMNKQFINSSRIVPFTSNEDTEDFIKNAYKSFDGEGDDEDKKSAEKKGAWYWMYATKHKAYVFKDGNIYNKELQLKSGQKIKMNNFFPDEVKLSNDLIFTNGPIAMNTDDYYIGYSGKMISALSGPKKIIINKKYKAMFSSSENLHSAYSSGVPFKNGTYYDSATKNQDQKFPFETKITFENFSNVKYFNSNLLLNYDPISEKHTIKDYIYDENNQSIKDLLNITTEEVNKIEIMKALEAKDKIVM